jgi:ribonuclease R
MIEEFMLLQKKWLNLLVNKKTFIYRIHDEPNAELVALQTVIAKFGYKIDLRSKDDFEVIE